jgi:hypothetical protein
MFLDSNTSTSLQTTIIIIIIIIIISRGRILLYNKTVTLVFIDPKALGSCSQELSTVLVLSSVCRGLHKYSITLLSRVKEVSRMTVLERGSSNFSDRSVACVSKIISSVLIYKYQLKIFVHVSRLPSVPRIYLFRPLQ